MHILTVSRYSYPLFFTLIRDLIFSGPSTYLLQVVRAIPSEQDRYFDAWLGSIGKSSDTWGNTCAYAPWRRYFPRFLTLSAILDRGIHSQGQRTRPDNSWPRRGTDNTRSTILMNLINDNFREGSGVGVRGFTQISIARRFGIASY